MTTTMLRRQVKRRVDSLTEERLKVADEFLAYLEERESREATEELLEIPGFVEAFEEGKKDIAAGDRHGRAASLDSPEAGEPWLGIPNPVRASSDWPGEPTSAALPAAAGRGGSRTAPTRRGAAAPTRGTPPRRPV